MAAAVEAGVVVELGALDLRHARLRLRRPEDVAAMKRSVERHGVLQPLVGNQEGEHLVLLDGFKRRAALEALGRSQAPVRVVRLSAVAAVAALVTHNVAARHRCELEEGWVVHALVRKHGQTQLDVGKLMGRHKSWVIRRLMLVERLAAQVQEDMRLGLLRSTSARCLALLPRGNQARVAEVAQRHGLSSRQVSELVERCRSCADADALEELLADPLRFLQQPLTQARTKYRDPRLSKPGEQIRRQLLLLESGASRVCEALRRHPLGELTSVDHTVLGELAAAMLKSTRAACGCLERLQQAAGGGQTHASTTPASSLRGDAPQGPGRERARDCTSSGDRSQDGATPPIGDGGST